MILYLLGPPTCMYLYATLSQTVNASIVIRKPNPTSVQTHEKKSRTPNNTLPLFAFFASLFYTDTTGAVDALHLQVLHHCPYTCS